MRGRGYRIAVDLGFSATSFVLPLVLGPLGVDAVTAHGFFDEARADHRTTGRLPTAPRGSSLRSPPTSASCSTGRGSGSSSSTNAANAFPETALLLFVRLLVDTGRTGTIAVPVTVTSLVDTLVEGAACR